MGATVWLQVKNGSPTDSRDNSALFRLEAELAALAKRLGVRPLTDFYDYGALADEAAEFAEELAEAGIDPPAAPDQWFDSRDGLKSFQAITDDLRVHPEPLGAEPWSNHWHQMLIDDLAYCGARLREAAEIGQEFRLQVVP